MSQVQQAFIKCLPRGGQVLGTQSNLWPQGSLGEMFMMDEGKSEQLLAKTEVKRLVWEETFSNSQQMRGWNPVYSKKTSNGNIVFGADRPHSSPALAV